MYLSMSFQSLKMLLTQQIGSNVSNIKFEINFESQLIHLISGIERKLEIPNGFHRERDSNSPRKTVETKK
jgi:hypothetical protein